MREYQKIKKDGAAKKGKEELMIECGGRGGREKESEKERKGERERDIGRK